MAKLQMPNDRDAILWMVFDRVLGLKLADKQLIIPKVGDPQLLSHQLGLQDAIEAPSVRMGVNELIGAGKIVTSEPEWVDAQPEGSEREVRVLYGRAVV